MRRACVVLSGVALATAACTRDGAQLVVVISSSLAVPAELDAVDVVVRDAAGTPGETRSVALTSDAELPASFGVVPKDGDPSRRVDLEVIAKRGGARLFSSRVRTQFAAGKRLRLDVRLDRRCTSLACEVSCVEGACGDAVEVDPTTLVEYTGLPDTGVAPRDGGVDSGVDTGPAAGDTGPDSGPRDGGPPPPDTGPRDGGPLPSCTYGNDYLAARERPSGDVKQLQMVAGPGEYGVAWARFDYPTERGELHFIRIAGDGASRADDGLRAIGSTFTGTTSRIEHPSLLWTGSDYAVAWADTRQTPAPEVSDVWFGRIARAAGSPVTSRRVRAAPELEERPVLLMDGASFLIAYFFDYSSARLTRTSSAGAPLIQIDPEMSVAGWIDLAPAPGRREIGVVSSQYVEGSNNDLYFRRVDPSVPSVVTIAPPPLAATPINSLEPALVAAGSGYGLLWLEEREGVGYEIWFMRLDLDGRTALRPTMLVPAVMLYERPSLAWTQRDGFLFGYRVDLSWTLARIAEDGTTTPLAPHPIEATATPAIAPAADGFAVTWAKDEDIHFTYVRCP